MDGEGVDAGALALSLVPEDVAGCACLSECRRGGGRRSVLAASPPLSVLAAGLLPPRKSVWYQPLPFNWKPGSRDELAQGFLAAGGAGGERSVAELLQALELVAALGAAVFVDGHDPSVRVVRLAELPKALIQNDK